MNILEEHYNLFECHSYQIPALMRYCLDLDIYCKYRPWLELHVSKLDVHHCICLSFSLRPWRFFYWPCALGFYSVFQNGPYDLNKVEYTWVICFLSYHTHMCLHCKWKAALSCLRKGRSVFKQLPSSGQVQLFSVLHWGYPHYRTVSALSFIYGTVLSYYKLPIAKMYVKRNV